jgi:hypothetical protein
MATDPAIAQTDDEDAPLVASGRLRAEAIRRLQIGLAGLFTMILLVSLANIIRDRAQESEDSTVPNAVASAETSTTPAKDPLADAGVVPELPTEPSASPSAGAHAGNAPPH